MLTQQHQQLCHGAIEDWAKSTSSQYNFTAGPSQLSYLNVLHLPILVSATLLSVTQDSQFNGKSQYRSFPNMSILHLPEPLPSTSIALGQITTNPLSAPSDSIKPSIPSEYIRKAASSKKEDAELTAQLTLTDPSQLFDTLRNNTSTQDSLRKLSQQNKPIYFVTGIQTSKSRSHKRATVSQEPITEATETPQTQQVQLPFRRIDSASNMASPGEEGSVVAVELLKVKCRIGAVNEPHCISDVDYVWSYHALEGEDEDLQLSIGLGKPVEEREWKELTGSKEERVERDANHNWSYDYEDSDDGLGGF